MIEEDNNVKEIEVSKEVNDKSNEINDKANEEEKLKEEEKAREEEKAKEEIKRLEENINKAVELLSAINSIPNNYNEKNNTRKSSKSYKSPKLSLRKTSYEKKTNKRIEEDSNSSSSYADDESVNVSYNSNYHFEKTINYPELIDKLCKINNDYPLLKNNKCSYCGKINKKWNKYCWNSYCIASPCFTNRKSIVIESRKKNNFDLENMKIYQISKKRKASFHLL